MNRKQNPCYEQSHDIKLIRHIKDKDFPLCLSLFVCVFIVYVCVFVPRILFTWKHAGLARIHYLQLNSKLKYAPGKKIKERKKERKREREREWERERKKGKRRDQYLISPFTNFLIFGENQPNILNVSWNLSFSKTIYVLIFSAFLLCMWKQEFQEWN